MFDVPVDFRTLAALAGIAVNVFIAYNNSQTRAEIMRLKVWILENFQRQKVGQVSCPECEGGK